MIRNALCVGVVSLGLAATAAPAWAHHSGVWFDRAKWVAVEAVITKVEWKNPHMWVYLEKKDQNGTVVKCSFEGPGGTAAAASGVSPQVLKVGNFVTIEGHPGRDGSCGGDFQAVTFDGKKYYPRGSIVRD